MSVVSQKADINHVCRKFIKILLSKATCIIMIFSKSFGYAVRGVLYVAFMQPDKQFVQVEEIALTLGIPRHFMGKILKLLAKEGVLASNKGPSGGFTINGNTLSFPLLRLIDITNGMSALNNCVLRAKDCNSKSPCPMHGQVEAIKKELKNILSGTTIKDLLYHGNKEFVKSISVEDLAELKQVTVN
jgi:Rrf2 family protein